jgi:ABC-type nickel/cobalt efflux system permease component RcnA
VIAAWFYTIPVEMKRLAVLLIAASAALLVLAPAALAHDGGEGWYGVTNDKVTTNAGFILIVFFPLFVFVMSMIQWRLDKRKERRKKTHKALAGDEQAWRGGW